MFSTFRNEKEVIRGGYDLRDEIGRREIRAEKKNREKFETWDY